MKPSPRPTVALVLAVVLLGVTAYLVVSIVQRMPVELSPRGIGFPLLTLVFGVLALALGIWQLIQRRRYLASTTPQQRAELEAEARAAKSRDRLGGPVDYGDRVDRDE